MAIDPVTLAILKGRLEQIADEMDATLFRSAFNPIIAEAHDASHGIYDATTGDTLVQGKSGLPIFVGVMAFAVKAVIDKAAKQGGVHEGDVWIFNDPYDGGTHLSDLRLVGRCSAMAKCSATSPRSATGTTWAATCRATTTRPPPSVFRKAC
jgi:N-methylhydantoinase B